MNNMGREIMAALKRFQTGSDGDPVTVGGQLAVTGTTTTSPAIVAAGDTNTGIFFPAADTIAFAEGGAEAMRIDSSGNVGIGTTSPTFINGSGLAVARSGGAAEINVNRTDASTAGSVALISGAASNTLRGSGVKDLTFQTNDLERMRIDSSGNVLVGTTTAASTQGGTLQVITAQAIRRNIAGSGGPALRMEKSRSASDGNYTIVQDGDTLGDIQWYGSDGVDFAQAAAIRGIVNGTPGSDDMPGALAFLTSADGSASPTERMRITSDGYLRMASGTGGIQFNGDTDAANALDDYEEGTWTPVIADASTGGNASPTAATSAIYTKVGRMVTVQCFFTNVDTTGMTAGNDVFIRGFPFTAASVAGTTFVPGSIMPQQISFSGYLTPYINDNNTFGRIGENTTGAVVDFIVVSEFTSGATDFFLNLTYQAA
jgi:hypothetical protein